MREDRLRDHWYWREGWGVGTRYLTWHLTWEDHPALHEHAARYRAALSPFGVALAPVPDQWLHLTMQGVGHTRDLSPADLDALVDAARAHLVTVPQPVVTFGTPVAHYEGVDWEVTSAPSVAAVREATRAAIDDALGEDRRPADSPWGFVPHVTLAYATRDLPATPVNDALQAVAADPTTVTVTHASLIEIHRDDRQYEWRTLAKLPLGQSARQLTPRS